MAQRIVVASVFVALAGVLFTSPAGAAVTVFGPGPAQLCYEAAEFNLNFHDNIGYCNEALGSALSDHDRAATYINRGVLRLAHNEAGTALTDFDSGLALDANLAEGYVDRGASLIELKRFADAIKDIDKGLSMGAKRAHIAYYDRAMADEAMGDVTAAYNDYQQSLAAKPDFTPASDELKRFKVVRKPATGT